MHVFSLEEIADTNLFQLLKQIQDGSTSPNDAMRMIKKGWTVKTKRKVIQTSTIRESLVVLCDDGTLWCKWSGPKEVGFVKVPLGDLDRE